ncbi:MAG: carbohydrate ABC transporter permease [Christensenellales bacterium]|jgi:putative aldouronate transport system permease protein|nr:carbohydrate ABC transporter permease [Clostridiales bacterium]
MKYMTRGMKIFRVFNYIFITLVSLSCFLPLLNTLAVSFSSPVAVSTGKVYFWPIEFTTMAYEFALKGGKFMRALQVSALRCLLGVSINLFMMITTAYPLSKSRQRFGARNYYMVFYVFTILFGGGLIPYYILVNQLGLLNSIWSLVLPLSVPVYNMIILMNFMRGLPHELEEAAMVDGAGIIRTLVNVILPVLTPALATVGLFSFVYHWNDWLTGALFMHDPKNYPLQTYLQTLLTNFSELLRQSGSDYYSLLSRMNEQTGRAAQLFLALLPMLIIYPFVQKYFTTGLVMGSVKG